MPGETCRLTLVHDGFAPGELATFREVGESWPFTLSNLKTLLENGRAASLSRLTSPRLLAVLNGQTPGDRTGDCVVDTGNRLCYNRLAMSRKNITYNQPLEKEIGFSRAVRIGNHIAVTGTAPIAKDGSVASPGDVYGQTKRSLEIIKDVIERAGGRVEDIVRTRILLTDITTWQEAARAHRELFADIQPACTILQVSGFVNPEWLVEIEADAIMEEHQSGPA